MDQNHKPINGSSQYPHKGFIFSNNPEMEITKVIAFNLSAWMENHPTLGTLKKVASASGVGFGTIQRISNNEGNPTSLAAGQGLDKQHMIAP